MTTIVDFRDRVKAALGITASSSERGFGDAHLDEHVKRAVQEFSIYVAAEASADLAISAGTRTLDVSSLTRLLRVAAVETPVGQWPRAFVDFSQWGATLTLDIAPPAVNTTARVYYEQRHLVDESGSTVAPEHEHVIVEGATAFALLARAAGAAQTLETATAQPLTYQHLRIAQSRLAHWRAQVRRLSGRVVRHRLFVPAGGPVQHSAVGEP
jgi:hypothetical protein